MNDQLTPMTSGTAAAMRRTGSDHHLSTYPAALSPSRRTGIVDAACWLEAQRKLDRNRTLCSNGAGTTVGCPA